MNLEEIDGWRFASESLRPLIKPGIATSLVLCIIGLARHNNINIQNAETIAMHNGHLFLYHRSLDCLLQLTNSWKSLICINLFILKLT